ncbi:MAG TPA: hypothetical protein VLS48_03795 [Anaerolineales bacterium]|nr:hypothetical protein [Anaerolineales bacterium]
MSDPSLQPEENLADEIRALGQNLIQVLRSAWDHPERKRLQRELENGLYDLSNTVNREMEEFKESPTGQRLRTDVENLQERVRTGEAEAKVRSELLHIMRTINQELQKVTQPGASPPASAAAAPDGEEQPNE